MSARSSRSLLARLIAAVVVIAVLVAGFIGAPVGARAAGNAQLDLTISAVDPTTGAPITTAKYGVNAVAYRIDYSCSTDTCENTKVKLDPTQLDPNHNYYRLLVQSGFNPPATPATISGSATAGYTVSLGRLAAGQSGQFTVVYSYAPQPPRRVGGITAESNGWSVATFPDGFEIRQSATITSDTAVAPKTATDGGVIYQSVGIGTPGVAQAGPGARVLTETSYTYFVYMTSGCTQAAYHATYGRVVASNEFLCASDYQVVHQLPPGVELVSAGGNPAVSGTVATGLILTWNAPSWTPGSNAEGGWLSLDGSNGNFGSSPRSVTVRFPRANFAPSDRTCNYDATSAAWRTSAHLTYISLPGQPGLVRDVSSTSAGITVSCVEPYAKAVADPKLSTFDGATRPVANESQIRVPAAGSPPNEKQWTVTVGNQANVSGVAVVTDNSLDLADAPVYRIEASLAGASVAWTATNGTSTLSGTSPAPVDAPAGYRFATAVVTSPPLAGPNQYATQTARTNFTVTYKYRVSSSAPVGGRRTNTASARMTYPDYPQLTPVNLTIPSHTIVFAQPFARGDASKASTGTLTSGEYRITLPTSGNTQPSWWVDVNNRSNVPAVPIVDEPDLRAPGDLPVTLITFRYHNGAAWVLTGGTVEYTLDNGVTGTATVTAATSQLAAPTGRSFIKVRVVGDPIDGRNTPTRSDATIFRVYFVYTAPSTAPVDVPWTNRATAQLTFPSYPELATITNQVSATARLIAPTPPASTFTASVGRAALPGGATAAGPTTDVTFRVAGTTSSIATGRNITPQYVFVAPAGWTIDQGSASFPANTVPAGVQFAYRTVTIAGVQRQAVVATWPTGVFFGKNVNLPTMSVVARPGTGLAAGTVSRADGYIGNSAAALANDVFTTPLTDTPDLDADGNVTERFSTAGNAGTATTIASQPAMRILKEICLPTPSAADGCEWIADPANTVGVAPNTTSIRYRLTVTNSGNVNLSDVVGYDVLPYPGDTGTSDATGATPRGSTIREHVSGVSDVSAGLQVTYSDAEQPCRPEVDPTVPGCVNDWHAIAAGAQAVRLSRPGTLAPGASASLQYTAAVVGNPGNSAIGCNSLAVRVTGLATVSEPAAVCAAIEETDLRIVAGTPNLQIGRPGTLPFVVTNLGGAQSSQARVTVAVPQGVTATSLVFGGWTCTAVDANGGALFGSAPGPATLTCRPDQALQLAQPRALDVPVVSQVAQFSSTAEVTGRVFDGNLANNTATVSASAAAAAGEIGVTKTDGRTVARPGDLLTYTIAIHNPLLFETLTGGTLTDTLPRTTDFVSASDGGTLSGNTVRWTLPAIAADATLTRTVTVRVLTTVFTDQLQNTVSVTAPDPANTALTLSGSADDVDDVVTNPGLTLTKGSAAPTFDHVGEVITYTLTAENTGDVTLHAVSITDPKPGLSPLTYSWPGGAGVLAPGERVTATATYTVTQADIDATEVTNTATARGLAPDDDPTTDSDSHRVESSATPSIQIDKSSSGQPDAAGDVVSYGFRVTNNGPLTLTGVEVVDGMNGLSGITLVWPGAGGQLAPGQSVTGTATYTVTQADVDAGRIVNTAQARGRTLGGAAVEDADSETIDIERSPVVSATKSGVFTGGSDARAGDVVEYTLSATNDGNTTLTGVSIADPLPGLSGLTYDWPGTAGVLLPGQTVSATATYPLTQEDVDAGEVRNTAHVTGTSPTGDVDAAASEVVEFTSTPVITIRKTAAGAVDSAGDAVTYSFVVTNDGSLTLTDVSVADALPGLSSIVFGAWPGADGVLAPGESVTATATYAATQADVDAGTIVNTATVAGRTLAGTAVGDEDTATVEIDRTASVTIEKTGAFAGGSDAHTGDPVDYGFTVTNGGNTTLTGVSIADPLPGLSGIVYSWPSAVGVLSPGQSATATATYHLVQADVDAGHVSNTATATASSPVGDVTDDASKVVPFTSTPSLALIKSASGAIHRTGDVVTYTFRVTNDGPLTLTDVDVTDDMAGLSDIVFGAWPGSDGTLVPGQSVTATATYTVTQADIDAGRIDNTATATGNAPGGATTSASASATVVIDRAPSLTIVKDGAYGDGQDGDAGDDILYDFTVTNTGNTTLTDVEIADPLPGLGEIVAVWPGAPGVLLPGQTMTATAPYVITQHDVDASGVTNTATVTSAAPDGSTPGAEDSITMATPADAGLQLAKTAHFAGPLHAGDQVEYRLAVTNTGILTLHDVQVTDPMPGLSPLTYEWPGAEGRLARGETVVATGTYTLTQADLDRGDLENTGTVVGTTPAGATVEDEDSLTTVLPTTAQVRLHKTGSVAPGVWKEGDLVTFDFTLENRGNTTLGDVAIDDGMTGLSPLEYTWPGEAGVLAPGETAHATATYRLTAEDATRRTLTNEATARSDRAPDDTAAVTLRGPAPGIPAVIDGISAGLANTGGTVSWLPAVLGVMALIGGLLIIARRRRHDTME